MRMILDFVSLFFYLKQANALCFAWKVASAMNSMINELKRPNLKRKKHLHALHEHEY
jgi:hypothetical protein